VRSYEKQANLWGQVSWGANKVLLAGWQ